MSTRALDEAILAKAMALKQLEAARKANQAAADAVNKASGALAIAEQQLAEALMRHTDLVLERNS